MPCFARLGKATCCTVWVIELAQLYAGGDDRLVWSEGSLLEERAYAISVQSDIFNSSPWFYTAHAAYTGRAGQQELLKDCEEVLQELLEASHRLAAEKAAFEVEKAAWAANQKGASGASQNGQGWQLLERELVPDFTQLSISPSDTYQVTKIECAGVHGADLQLYAWAAIMTQLVNKHALRSAAPSSFLQTNITQ